MVKIEEASSSSFTHPWKYHVFLSFRGEDTGNNFTGHLCSALLQKGITTFMDDELRRGEELSTTLVQSIEQSRISIIVFSENYASSKWCLDELVKILECKKSSIQQMVLPIFYKVDPSDIRNHKKSFGEALANHERKFKGNLDKVQKWKKALSEAANLSGWPLLDEHHSESKFICDIVEEVSKQFVEHTYSEVVKIEEASSSSFTHPWKYHVFLSFRGEDTRNNFTGHLCSALLQKGITTFMDDELRRGEEISTALVQAIEQSRISLIVFSENFASSKWCLDELVKILECKNSSIQQMVLPVFYKVDPSDIRNHRNSFGEALANHERKFNGNLDKVQKWKKALSEAADLYGWHLLDEHDSESKFIGDIVEEISKKVIDRTYLEVAKYPVGIEPRVQYVKELLSVEGREEFRMVGIWGIGGIGKTTIAKAVYNSISHNFDGSCFLENVRVIHSSRGLVKLQQTLLFEILGGTKVKVTNASKGITMIKEFLRCKRVLVVLDDVNHLAQLNSLAGESDWFGTGSRIIITTRDKKLLIAHNVNLIYKVNELDYHEALELFCWNAFKRNEPLDYFVELTKCALCYAQGLPLALSVLGSCLYGGNLDTWKARLDGFKSPEIQAILKISYDALDDTAKEVFLDIACFFKGGSTDYVFQVLEGCGLNPKYGIDILVEKALINIDLGYIWMHDLLEEMGKDIVYQESRNDLGERSRLWFHDDVYHVLTENIGTSKIIGIKVELPKDSDVICLSGTTFSQMRNLRLFIYRAGSFCGALNYLPNSLRVVDWPDCPFQSLPSNFNPKNLVLLHMPRSRITRIGEGFKVLKNLTSIKLRNCEFLKKVSDLSGIPNLQTLDLQDCKNLVEVHHSVGFLDKLKSFTLNGCSRLMIFPTTISWNSLRYLWLDNCKRLESFIEIVNKMQSIEQLSLCGSGIKELPSWIGYLTSLRELDVSKSPIKELPSSIGGLSSLTKLDVSGTLITELPSSIGDLTSLTELDVSRTVIIELPSSIGGLTSLTVLDVSGTLIIELPSSIGGLTSLPKLDLSGTLITKLPSSIGYLTSLTCLNVSGTPITELPSSIGYLTSLTRLNVSGTPITELPSSIGRFISLKFLSASRCANLKNVPHSIYGGLQHLRHLDLSWCPKLVTFPNRVGSLVSSSAESLSPAPMLPTTSYVTHDNCDSLLFPKLEDLDFRGCNLISVFDFLSNLDCVSTLRYINLSHSSFDSLPACISKFRQLNSINLSGCKWLQDISKLPPNLYKIWLVDCVSLEVFSTLSNILEQKNSPVIRRMDLCNCYRLVDNLGIDVVSKMAKALLNQILNGNLCMPFDWKIMLSSLSECEVPNWFHYRKMDICELLIEIPRSMIRGKIGLVVCVIFEITQALSNLFYSFYMDVMVDEINISPHIYCYPRPGSSGHVVYFKYIGIDILLKPQVDKKNDQSLPHIFRVRTYMKSDQPLLVKSCGLHLANKPGNDNDDKYMLGNDDDDDDAVAEEEEGENYGGDGDARGEDLAKKQILEEQL